MVWISSARARPGGTYLPIPDSEVPNNGIKLGIESFMFIDILRWIRGAKCKFEIKGLTYSKFVKCLGIRLDEDFVDCSDDLFWSQNY